MRRGILEDCEDEIFATPRGGLQNDDQTGGMSGVKYTQHPKHSRSARKSKVPTTVAPTNATTQKKRKEDQRYSMIILLDEDDMTAIGR
jgi:hypothetical protein